MAETEPDWRLGRDIDGLPVVRYQRGEREGRPWASLLEVLGPGAPGVGEAVSTVDPVEFVLSDMSGWIVSGPVDFGERLLRRGARALRLGHAMLRDLAGDPPPAGWADWALTPLRDGYRSVPCDRDAEELAPALGAAFGPGHPDHRPDRDEQAGLAELRALLAGRIVGPVLPSSALIVDADDQVVAGAVVTDFDGTPWIAHVFRHPGLGYPGLGRDVMRRVMADLADRGSPEMGLAVTEGNAARHLYESLGFRLTKSTLTVIVP
ncbi:GNAT family N-acetyltransferase [Kitasatospora sp. NPDC058218]|uniref:GNAT family N-acetyltransferase n=1 Tax=Kitasatospora sp. NPDC058218 TaxID=3346385 RepID=UPI0036D81AF5